MTQYPPVEYQNYLELDQLLSAQKLQSEAFGAKAHDEMLFIIVHQAYELWFKQILTEFDSVIEIFQSERVDDTHMGTVTHRLNRVIEIQKLLVQQITVLETMTPLDFLDFRDFLYPASGFQSAQNRLIENKLGLDPQKRLRFNQIPYKEHLDAKYRPEIEKSEKTPSLFYLVEKWLERTPFLDIEGYSFWKEYRRAVISMFESDRAYIVNNPELSDEQMQHSLNEMDRSVETFQALFEEEKYEELRKTGQARLSLKATHAALFIGLYRDEPALQKPFELIRCLLDIDENFTTWRYRHALMAHRMLGRKIGTGGSSGHKYLAQATEKHKIFTDFFNLVTFFLPRSKRPELPSELRKKLSFNYAH